MMMMMMMVMVVMMMMMMMTTTTMMIIIHRNVIVLENVTLSNTIDVVWCFLTYLTHLDSVLGLVIYLLKHITFKNKNKNLAMSRNSIYSCAGLVFMYPTHIHEFISVISRGWLTNTTQSLFRKLHIQSFFRSTLMTREFS